MKTPRRKIITWEQFKRDCEDNQAWGCDNYDIPWETNGRTSPCQIDKCPEWAKLEDVT